ncbi:twin-arginine translocase TatA/TatE family subunit [Haloarchaeobius litoreus]|uniref:Sec-independent protein translocase protein TatA n=1 Tax=Haloarchaeobius litoreus TaxID=755306 RepID=A0ABD6DJ31_9EURY|nr:twin-arginine translocase TatA/TatE family subunit [Haloarchaeobius litoreus]
MMIPLFIGGIGGPEIVLIFLLVILLFGADKLPKLARSSGEAMGEFQKGREEVERELKAAKESTVSTKSGSDEASANDVEDIETTTDAVDDDATDKNASLA